MECRCGLCLGIALDSVLVYPGSLGQLELDDTPSSDSSAPQCSDRSDWAGAFLDELRVILVRWGLFAGVGLSRHA